MSSLRNRNRKTGFFLITPDPQGPIRSLAPATTSVYQPCPWNRETSPRQVPKCHVSRIKSKFVEPGVGQLQMSCAGRTHLGKVPDCHVPQFPPRGPHIKWVLGHRASVHHPGFQGTPHSWCCCRAGYCPCISFHMVFRGFGLNISSTCYFRNFVGL